MSRSLLRMSPSVLAAGGTTAAELETEPGLTAPQIALRCVRAAPGGPETLVATGRVTMLAQTTAGWQMNLSVPDGAPATGGSVRWELVVSEAGAGFEEALPVIVA